MLNPVVPGGAACAIEVCAMLLSPVAFPACCCPCCVNRYDESELDDLDLLPHECLQKYIRYAKETCKPTLSPGLKRSR